MELPEKPDKESIKRSINRLPEDYEIEIEELSYRKIIVRTIIILLGNIIGFVALAPLHIGLNIDNIFTAAIVVILLSLFNSLLWPVLSRVFMPFLLLTFGIGTFVINGVVLMVLTWFIPGFSMESYAYFLTPLSMAIVTTILSEIMTIDGNSAYYRSFTKEALKRRERNVKRKKGMIILEIDGLAREILEEAIDKGLDKSTNLRFGSEDDGNLEFRAFELLTGGRNTVYTQRKYNPTIDIGQGIGWFTGSSISYEEVCDIIKNGNGAVILAVETKKGSGHAMSVAGINENGLFFCRIIASVSLIS